MHLGDEIYERDIRAQVEANHHGAVVAIDVDSGSWAIGDTVIAATDSRRIDPLFRLVPPSTRKSLFVRRFRDQRLPPYRLVMCSTTQQGPNLAPICGTTRDPAVQRACPQPRSHSSHWRSTAALPSAHPDITSDRLNHDRKSLHSRPNH